MRHGIAAGCVANLARGRDWERDLASHNRGPKRGIDHSKESEDTLWKLTSSLATLLQNVHKESFRGVGCLVIRWWFVGKHSNRDIESCCDDIWKILEVVIYRDLAICKLDNSIVTTVKYVQSQSERQVFSDEARGWQAHRNP